MNITGSSGCPPPPQIESNFSPLGNNALPNLPAQTSGALPADHTVAFVTEPPDLSAGIPGQMPLPTNPLPTQHMGSRHLPRDPDVGVAGQYP